MSRTELKGDDHSATLSRRRRELPCFIQLMLPGNREQVGKFTHKMTFLRFTSSTTSGPALSSYPQVFLMLVQVFFSTTRQERSR